MAGLESLNWISRFIDETPSDSEHGGKPRQVPGVCYSQVQPTNPPKAKLRLWSQEMARQLGIDDGDDFVLGGSNVG